MIKLTALLLILSTNVMAQTAVPVRVIIYNGQSIATSQPTPNVHTVTIREGNTVVKVY
jgi:hypothetical protein